MSRGITNRRDAISALRLRLISDLGSIDYWTGEFDLGPEIVGLLLDARGSLRETIELVAACEEMMVDEER